VQSCSEILNGEKYLQYSEKFQGKLCFSGQAQVAQKKEKNSVHIHLGVIRVIWASVVCNLDQRRHWL